MKAHIPNILPNDLVLDAMPGIAYIFSADGKLLAWNKVAEEITGYSKDELLQAFAGIPGEEKGNFKLKAALKQALLTGLSRTEHIIHLKDGRKLPLFGSVNKVSVDGVDYLIGLSVDIRELYAARETIKEQVQEISDLNEMLQAENIFLKRELASTKSRNRIIGESDSLNIFSLS